MDDLTGDGDWIPFEGKLKEPSTWISHSVVKTILSSEKFKAKNVVVIADSCYSGTLLRGGPSLLSIDEWNYRQKLFDRSFSRSRQVNTSGGVEPVVDGGRDGHSLFAYYLLKALKENKRDVVDLENLFHASVWKPVSEIGGQRPSVGRLKTPMDEDGQFVLELKIKSAVSPPIGGKGLEEKRAQVQRKREKLERLRLELEEKRLDEELKRIASETKKQVFEKDKINTSPDRSEKEWFDNGDRAGS